MDQERLDAARRAQAAFHEEVRLLHTSGATEAELVGRLGLTPEQVRQIIGPGAQGGDLLHCSFCGRTQKEVRKIIAGPGVYICDGCATALSGRADDVPEGGTCSFCGQSTKMVESMAAGPAARICDECLDLCNEILTEEGLD